MPSTAPPKIVTLSKTRSVEEWLRAEIASGRLQEGDKLPSEYDLAREMGVAYLTMRAATEPLVRDGLLRRVRGKGTFITVPAARKETQVNTVALMVPSLPALWNVTGFYFPRVVQGFCDEAHRQDLEPVIVGRPKNLFSGDPAPTGSYAGLACLLVDSDDLAAVDVLAQMGTPLVAINLYRGHGRVSSVIADQAAGAASAVKHLIDLGHRRIAFLPGPAGNLDSEERYRGFEQAMRKHQATIVPVESDDASFTEASGAALTRELLARRVTPTAIVAASDLIAAGAIMAARDAGLDVPRDVSVVGFGDFAVSTQVNPKLTTVHLPLEQLGAGAVTALMKGIRGEGVETIHLATELIRRKSTGIARQSGPTV
jgi:DNA-binding LacI/PurR family transcriptional regulator